jgi:hypothetical protein
VQGYPLAGVAEAKECYCGGKPGGGDNVFRLGAADNCDIVCPGDVRMFCGGSKALSVFATNPGTSRQNQDDVMSLSIIQLNAFVNMTGQAISHNQKHVYVKKSDSRRKDCIFCHYSSTIPL